MESPRKRITIDEANEISCSYTNETVLHTACRKDDSVQVQRLIDTGADIEAANTEGMTPLHEASRRGVTRVRQVVGIVGYLKLTMSGGVTSGDKMHAEIGDNLGDTPATIYELWRHGAQIQRRDICGRTPLHASMDAYSLSKNSCPLVQTRAQETTQV
jgi:hypothetical protein